MENGKKSAGLYPYWVGLAINICMRHLCLACNQRPRAVAYHRADRIQYRRLCEACIKRRRRIKPPDPRWKTAGYKKKPTCDRCGFRAKFSAQIMVYHVDGNMNNITVRNLKSICQNCAVDINKSDLPWRPGDLSPDF
jgi:hypothetical protein